MLSWRQPVLSETSLNLPELRRRHAALTQTCVHYLQAAATCHLSLQASASHPSPELRRHAITAAGLRDRRQAGAAGILGDEGGQADQEHGDGELDGGYLDLLQGRLVGGSLGGCSGHKPNHGQAPIDPLQPATTGNFSHVGGCPGQPRPGACWSSAGGAEAGRRARLSLDSKSERWQQQLVPPKPVRQSRKGCQCFERHSLLCPTRRAASQLKPTDTLKGGEGGAWVLETAAQVNLGRLLKKLGSCLEARPMSAHMQCSLRPRPDFDSQTSGILQDLDQLLCMTGYAHLHQCTGLLGVRGRG